MKIDIPMPPGSGASSEILNYLARLREQIIYLADQLDRVQSGEDEGD